MGAGAAAVRPSRARAARVRCCCAQADEFAFSDFTIVFVSRRLARRADLLAFAYHLTPLCPPARLQGRARVFACRLMYIVLVRSALKTTLGAWRANKRHVELCRHCAARERARVRDLAARAARGDGRPPVAGDNEPSIWLQFPSRASRSETRPLLVPAARSCRHPRPRRVELPRAPARARPRASVCVRKRLRRRGRAVARAGADRGERFVGRREDEPCSTPRAGQMTRAFQRRRSALACAQNEPCVAAALAERSSALSRTT
jgi:hypothetical protein